MRQTSRRCAVVLGVTLALVLGVLVAGAPEASAQQPPGAEEQRAQALFDEGRYAEAADAFRAILARDPSHRTANILLPFALARQGDAAGAVQQARRALQLYPEHTPLQLLLAGFLAQTDATRPEALQIYHATLQRDPDNRLARLGRAELARTQGRTLDAIHDFRVLAEQDPMEPRYLVRLSQLHGSLGDLASTRVYAERAYALAPANVDAIRALAILGDVEDRPQEALRFYRELLALYPNDVSAQLAVRASEERLGEPQLPISAEAMQKIPLEPYMEAVPRNSAVLRHRKEQLEATRRRGWARWLPSFFVSPSSSTVTRSPTPPTGAKDSTETLSFSFGWNLADLLVNPYRINTEAMEADIAATRASLMSDVSATYYQRQQQLLEYRRLQRALALAPLDQQIRQNKLNLKYNILHLTERLRILTGMP